MLNKNWKTSLTAVIAGVVILVNKYWELGLPVEVITAVGIGLVGLFAKDCDTTGAGDNARKES